MTYEEQLRDWRVRRVWKITAQIVALKDTIKRLEERRQRTERILFDE